MNRNNYVAMKEEKCVRFDFTKTVIIESDVSYLSKEMMLQVWWTSKEIKKFREDIKSWIQRTKKDDDDRLHILNYMYHVKGDVDFGDGVWKVNNIMDEDDDTSSSTAADDDATMRGLEPYLNPNLRKFCHRIRQSILHQNQTRCGDDMGGDHADDDDDDEVRSMINASIKNHDSVVKSINNKGRCQHQQHRQQQQKQKSHCHKELLAKYAQRKTKRFVYKAQIVARRDAEHAFAIHRQQQQQQQLTTAIYQQQQQQQQQSNDDEESLHHIKIQKQKNHPQDYQKQQKRLSCPAA